MRRTPIVLAATAAGLAGVLTFHTKSARLALGGLPQASATTGSPATTTTAGSSPGRGTSGTSSPPTSTTPTTVPSTTATTVPSTTPPTAPPTTTTTVPSTTRSATGPLVNYNYGELSVSVTVSGNKITKIGIASLNDGGNFRSQSIDQQSIPLLEQQALQAQSANIQGVSGASYTSAGFAQSLQSALGKLGL
ncbi:MAG TPA: FMN-binding protein [Acidimicrobiales bacterium]|nr:FMN-binding protein [Acidimicrobiales bacterium]